MASILLIDDSETTRAEVRQLLEADGSFETIREAADGIVGLRMLLEEEVDVVLCDLEMPGLDGEKLLQAQLADRERVAAPFLFLTASEDVDRRTRLIERGASDAMTKPFHGPDLVARLRLHLKIKQLQDELVLKNQRLLHQSSTDEITGLSTRRSIDELLETEFQRALRYDVPLCALMIDLDHFKAINDEHGHLAGDEVLRGVGERLRSRMRVTDVGGRFGGEEFLVVLAHSDLAGATIAAQRWCEAMAAAPVVLPDGSEIRVTMSIGVAACAPGMTTRQDLVAAADAALYRAKEKGRNRIEVAA